MGCMFSVSVLYLFGICGFVLAFLSYFVFWDLGEAGRPSLFWVFYVGYVLWFFVVFLWGVLWDGWGNGLVCCSWGDDMSIIYVLVCYK